MNNDLIERLQERHDRPGLGWKDCELLREAIAALSPALSSQWYDTCASIKRVIVDMVDEDPNKIVSRVNDILDTAFGLQPIPSPVLPEDVEAMIGWLDYRRKANKNLGDAADMLKQLWQETQYLEIPYFLRQPGSVDDDVKKYIAELQARIDELEGRT